MWLYDRIQFHAHVTRVPFLSFLVVLTRPLGMFQRAIDRIQFHARPSAWSLASLPA